LENLRNEYMAAAITTVDQVKTYRLLVMPPKPSQNSRRKRAAKLLRGLFNLQRMHSQRTLRERGEHCQCPRSRPRLWGWLVTRKSATQPELRRRLIMPSYSPELIRTMRAALDEVMTKIPVEQATPGIKAAVAECTILSMLT